MPIQNRIEMHFVEEDRNAINSHLDSLLAAVSAKSTKLSPEDRRKYGSIHERNKLFVNKTRDYYLSEPNLSSPEVNWTEFLLDWADREFIGNTILRLETIVEFFNNSKILHDYDNYQNSLVDYKYSKYKDSNGVAGFSVKVAALKEFFSGAVGNSTPPNSHPPA